MASVFVTELLCNVFHETRNLNDILLPVEYQNELNGPTLITKGEQKLK